MTKCVGCGSKLIDNSKKYCERCFKIIHYNQNKEVNNVDNYKILDKINKLGLFTIFVTDLLHLTNEVVNLYNSINNAKIMVINKMDIIPKNISIDHLKDNIKKRYNINNLLFISAKKNNNINSIINIINDYKNVIICGDTSSGKSTLTNLIVGSELTTSKYQNTTLDFIKLKYEDNIIYDSPGFVLDNYMNNEKINIVTKQLNDKYDLYIDDLIINTIANITIIYNDKVSISSKKSSNKLDKEYKIEKNSDILFNGGFIFVNKDIIIKSNKELINRKSIIK